MHPSALNRRTFLKASGISLALPWLEGFGKPAESPPKRALFICNTLGFYSPAFYPAKPGLDYEASEYLSLLKEHRDDLTVFSGLSHPDQGGEHQCEMTWLSAARNPGRDGFRNSISVDQLAAGQLGYVTRFPSLSLSSERIRSASASTSRWSVDICRISSSLRVSTWGASLFTTSDRSWSTSPGKVTMKFTIVVEM